MKSVNIPNSVTNIESGLFEFCSNLSSITIGSAVTSIGGNAFSRCYSLSSIEIPNSVTSIGEYAFYQCNGLTTVTYNAEKCTIMGSREKPVFSECGAITSVLIGESVKSIPSYAFYNCPSLASIEIPNSVENIGEYAFFGCSKLMDVTIGNSVTSIGVAAFAECRNLNSLIIGYSVQAIGDSAFHTCWSLTSVTSQNPTPPTCGTNVFGNVNTQDITLTVPAESVSLYKSADTWKNFKYPVSVGDKVESGGLTFRVISEIAVEIIAGTSKYSGYKFIPSEVTIDSNKYTVTRIGNEAFKDCVGLTSVDIPNTVSNIGNSAFYGCTGLTSVTSQNPTPPTCGTNVFGNVNTQDITLTVPAESVSLYKSADTWKNFKYPVSVGDTKEVGGITYKLISETAAEVIAGTSKYTGNITIPSEVTIDGNKFTVSRIGEKAFYECTGLTSVVIPNSVTTIGNYAFQGCTGLTSITIPNSVTSIGANAFESCRGLTGSLTIPNSVTSIGSDAFYSCSGFTGNLVIPNSVTSIGSFAFCGCSGLANITVESGNTVYDSRDNCNAIIETATNTLISGCKNTIIPNSVTTIGKSAFFKCNSLSSVVIPNKVSNIGNAAFYGCTGLTSVTSQNPTPPTCETGVFIKVNTQNIPLTVPDESVELYKSADTWKDFGTITGINGSGNETPTEPTLEEVWVHDFAGIGSNVRSVACMPNGEVAIANIYYSSAIAGTGKVEFYDMNGKMSKEYDVNSWLEMKEIGTTSDDNVFTAYRLGSGIAVDGVGNIVVNLGFPNATSSTNFLAIAPNGSMTHIECTVPKPGQSARADFIDVTGDIFNNAYIGLAIYNSNIQNNEDYVAVYNIFEGWHDSDFSYLVIPGSYLNSQTKVLWAKKTFSDDAENAPEFYVYNRSQSGIRYSDGTPETDMVVLEGDNFSQGKATNMGATAFEVNGNTYIVMPTLDSTGARANAFKIVNVTTGEVEITSQGVAGFDTNYMQDFGATVNNDGTVNIVQLVSGKYLAMYKFTPGTTSSVSLAAPMSDVEEVYVEDVDAPVEYYNLQGVRVENPSHGLYIKRQGGHTTKVVL